MTGTSSDAAFADAFVKGVPGLRRARHLRRRGQERDGRAAGRPGNPSVGRKGQIVAPFLGYTPSRVSEGVSWALEGDINDFGIANMAREARGGDERAGRSGGASQEEREYFLSRSQNYVNMFDPAIRFFQGRDAAGRWKSSPQDYDPRVWGHEHDYTETDGWNFAFHTPHDGQGLANLYGGRDALARKLDTFFSTPGDRELPRLLRRHDPRDDRGARRPHGPVGLLQPGLAPHPVHVRLRRAAAKTQEKVREVLRRLYLGSEIGQGYGGDEDNGETSAWYLFSALGFYPLQVGSDDYAIGSPLFKKATVHLENGRDLVVKAPRNSAAQRVRAGPEAQRAALQPGLPPPPRHRARRRRSSSRWARRPRAGRPGTDAAPPSVTQGRRAGAAAARHDGRRRRDRDDERRRRRGAVRRRLEHRRVADRRRGRAAVPLHRQPAGQLLHAHLGHRRRRRPARVGGEGLQRRQPLERARRAQRRDVPLALADAAVQARAPGRYAYYRIEVTEGGGTARRGRAARTRAGRHLAARHRRRPGGRRRRATRCRSR